MPRLPRYWTYLLLSDRGETYAGYTSNLRRRLRQHNARGNRGWTRGRQWRLVGAVRYFDQSSALRAERLLKGRGGNRQRKRWLARRLRRLERVCSQFGVRKPFGL